MSEENQKLNHVAIIMDGNGRWAKKRGLPRIAGHNAGMVTMKEIVRHSGEIGIKHLTVYAFSTENWKRSTEEVGGIFKLLVKYVDKELKELNQNNVRVKILGDYSKLPQDAISRLEKTLATTENNTGLQFNIALNYGGRDEITKSVRTIASMVADGKIRPEEINEGTIAEFLYTGKALANIPDPELVIRTSGEKRLSNYLTWQTAYSELVFTEVLWPDFTIEEYEKALAEYSQRQRRFGGR